MPNGVPLDAFQRPNHQVLLNGAPVPPDPARRTSIHPAPVGYYFTTAAIGLPDPVDLIESAADINPEEYSKDHFLSIRIFSDRSAKSDEPHLYMDIIKPYQETAELLLFTYDLIGIFKRNDQPYVVWNHVAVPVIYINVLGKLFAIPIFLWHLYRTVSEL